MQIQKLKLLNFRNYNKLDVSFNTNLNIIYGNNGSGKTNLVEAIYVLALSRSFKQVCDKTLIKKDSNIAKIEGSFTEEFTNNFKVIITEEGKKVKINDNKITKISDYISKINIVLFSPNDLKIIKDTPSIRRKYLNISLSQMNVLYLKSLSDYNKLLKMRNAYLKDMLVNGNKSFDYLNIITEKLIKIGLEVYKFRYDYINKINSKISSFYDKIGGNKNLKVEYKSDYSDKTFESLVLFYKKNLKKDLNFGKTTFGIHHDDLVFKLDEDDLKIFGSEGQQKNAVIAWKFSEIEIMKEEMGRTPILILDDLLSELDNSKIENILNLINESVQTFITTTDIDKISLFLKNKNYEKYLVNNGEVI